MRNYKNRNKNAPREKEAGNPTVQDDGLFYYPFVLKGLIEKETHLKPWKKSSLNIAFTRGRMGTHF